MRKLHNWVKRRKSTHKQKLSSKFINVYGRHSNKTTSFPLRKTFLNEKNKKINNNKNQTNKQTMKLNCKMQITYVKRWKRVFSFEKLLMQTNNMSKCISFYDSTWLNAIRLLSVIRVSKGSVQNPTIIHRIENNVECFQLSVFLHFCCAVQSFIFISASCSR